MLFPYNYSVPAHHYLVGFVSVSELPVAQRSEVDTTRGHNFYKLLSNQDFSI